MTGELQRSPSGEIRYKIPAWSVIDMIKEYASLAPKTTEKRIDCLRIPMNLIRFPGWAVKEYIERHCSYL